jgi:uncharacterized repeat protein (TIGR01451 family)
VEEKLWGCDGVQRFAQFWRIDDHPAAVQPATRVKTRFQFPSFAAATLAFLACTVGIQAQDFGLRVVGSPDPVVVDRQLSFDIQVTNLTGFTVTNIVVTNLFTASAETLSGSNAYGNSFGIAGLVGFEINILTNGQVAHVSFIVRPRVIGDLTNTTMVHAFAFTNVTNHVTVKVVSAIADLAAGIVGPPSGGLVNDSMTYSVSATNRGPDAVPNVMLTNKIPADVKFISVSPTNQNITFTNGSLRFNLGTLASNAAPSFLVTIQPTNQGDVTLLAEVGAVGVLDTNSANNFATNVFNVSSFGPAQLVAATNSPQQYNPQTGLMEQSITLSNIGTNTASSARVFVQGLTNRLFNAVGTNNGNPFVTYATNLAAGGSVDLLLEYFVPTRLAVPDPTLVAVEVSAFSPTIPSGTNVPISRLLILPSGRVLIEFPAQTNRNYTVLYCPDATFSNRTLVALPHTTAPADRVQWIDYGPPKTISHPTNTASRMYRVIANP